MLNERSVCHSEESTVMMMANPVMTIRSGVDSWKDGIDSSQADEADAAGVQMGQAVLLKRNYT